MLTEIYGIEKDTEALNPDEEALEIQRDLGCQDKITALMT